MDEITMFDKDSITVPIKSKEMLVATGKAGVIDPVIWSSSDETVATVDQNGVVTAHRYGRCSISARTESGNFTAECSLQTLFWDVTGSPDKGGKNYQFFYEPVYWAAEKGITKGFSIGRHAGAFGVGLDCERQDFALFLYRLAGLPRVDPAALSDLDNIFSDVSGLGDLFRRAIAWNYAKGIIKGFSAGPNAGKSGCGLPISRRDAMIMLWRYAGRPAATEKGLQAARSFTDVNGAYNESSDTFKAIAWAAGAGIANGYTTAGSLPKESRLTAPCYGCDLLCKREQLITFLYRYAKE